jgi:hypothetical protein
MVQKSYRPTIPTKRFFNNIIFIEKQVIVLKHLLSKRFSAQFNQDKVRHFAIRGVRKIRRIPGMGYFINLLRSTQYVGVGTVFNRLLLKAGMVYSNIFKQRVVVPRLTTSFIGNLIFLQLDSHFLT